MINLIHRFFKSIKGPRPVRFTLEQPLSKSNPDRSSYTFAFIFILVSGLIGCGTDTAVNPTLVTTNTVPTITASPTTIPSQSITDPLPTSTPATAPQLPTPIPTAILPPPTPMPPLKIAVPPDLIDWMDSTFSDFESDGQIQWLSEETPSLNNAQLAIVPHGNGTLLYQSPIALTVPFTTEWEVVTLAQAEEILATGHALVTVIDWHTIEPTHKALRVDGRHPTDPDYGLQQSWSLIAAEGYETAVSQLTPHLIAHWPQPSTIIHLAAVGDIMLDRALGYALSRGNLEYPFVGVAEQLQTADITVGNVESALGDTGESAPKSYTFRAPPEAAESLAMAGFDVVSLANNHGMDFGADGLLRGIELLNTAGVAPVGAGANLAEARTAVIQTINGLDIAFLGYLHVPVEVSGFDTESWTATADAPGLAWARPEWITEDVTAVREQADIVIVLLHSGFEYVEAPSPPQIAASYAAIDAGADLVIGHHAHILQGIEFYGDGVIVYGLGNFAFEITGPPETAVLNVWLSENGVHEIELLPAIVQFGGQPRLAEPWEATPILQQVYRLTNALNPQ